MSLSIPDVWRQHMRAFLPAADPTSRRLAVAFLLEACRPLLDWCQDGVSVSLAAYRELSEQLWMSDAGQVQDHALLAALEALQSLLPGNRKASIADELGTALR